MNPFEWFKLVVEIFLAVPALFLAIDGFFYFRKMKCSLDAAKLLVGETANTLDDVKMVLDDVQSALMRDLYLTNIRQLIDIITTMIDDHKNGDSKKVQTNYDEWHRSLLRFRQEYAGDLYLDIRDTLDDIDKKIINDDRQDFDIVAISNLLRRLNYLTIGSSPQKSNRRSL